MSLDHRKLTVYRRALDLVDRCDVVIEQLPTGHAQLRGQIDRAACGVAANIAEGAGEFRSREKARFYRMARRSAIEVAAWLDIVGRRRHASADAIDAALATVEEVVAMLVRLIKAVER